MMLSALELHRPGNYTTAPYLSNPIAKRYRSRMYAMDSENSGDDDNIPAHHGDAGERSPTAGSVDLDCTGSTVSSGDELRNAAATGTGGRKQGGVKLMGLSGRPKLLSVRK
jgi:hypothetical protein